MKELLKNILKKEKPTFLLDFSQVYVILPASYYLLYIFVSFVLCTAPMVVCIRHILYKFLDRICC